MVVDVKKAQELRELLKNPLEYVPRYFKVLTKPDKMGESKLVPMVLYPMQEDFLRKRGNRNIILKNRQSGCSTGVLADSAHAFFTRHYERQVIIAHDEETSQFLFQTVLRFLKNLPEALRPKQDWKSSSRLRLPDFDSYMYVESAQAENIGIGRSLTRAHLSEMGKWPARKAEHLFADVSQTVGEHGIITIESTPKGRGGKFFQLYEAAKRGEINYQCFFYPWWWDKSCVRPVSEPLKYTTEELTLFEQVKRQNGTELTPEQIQFRRHTMAELGDLFYQEYPENDVDCWLAGEGSVFDGTSIRRYLQQTWKGKDEGNFTIWKDVLGGERYVIGVDVASGTARGDYSVAAVLNVKRNEYVARLRGRMPTDLFAEEVLRLARRYNDAEIAVERTGHGHSVLKVLLDNNYPHIYYHMDYDSFTGLSSNEPGWKTSLKTKPQMLDKFGAIIRAYDIGAWSENLFAEASSMVWESTIGGRTKTVSGSHDDELDAVMIALMVRDQAPIEYETGNRRIQSYARI